MSKRRYKFNVTNIDELAKAHPAAIVEVNIPEQVIPARTERKASYSFIAKLLDCKLAVPGIEIIEGGDDEAPKPAFLGGKPVKEDA